MAQPCRTLARECYRLDRPSDEENNRGSLSIVVYHSEGKTRAPSQPAHSVPQIDPVKSSASFYQTVASREK